MTGPLDNPDHPLAKIIAEAEAATEREELEAAQARLRALLTEGFVKTESTDQPYSAAVEMTDAFRAEYFPQAEGGAEAGFGEFIGGFAVDAANALATSERRIAFRLKTLFGFRGLRMVEEGDSWTQYPILLEDIIDQLDGNSDFAIYSVGAAGDLVADMAQNKEYLQAIKVSKATAMLLSGGGNDLFGNLKDVLYDYTPGATPAALINDAAFGPVFRSVMAGYRTIISDVVSEYPHVVIFGHGYDLPFPLEDGKWIGPALQFRGIPFDVGREVLRVLMDRFNAALAELAVAELNFVYCDLRGQVDRGPNSWFDELHPKNAGYARAAEVIEGEIRKRMVGGTESASMTSAKSSTTGGTDGGAEHATTATKTIVLDPGHGGNTKVGGSSANNAKGPNGTLEKHVTLDVAQRARSILEDRGFDVLLTRETDVNSSLAARAGVAKAAHAAAFVSIHFNGFNNSTQGTETFVHSSLSAGGGQASQALCRAVQSEMIAALGHNDRNKGHPNGVKFGGFGVLNPASHASGTAAVLHEVSFMDTAAEEARLGTVSYRRKIATALADGIETYMAGTMGAEFATFASTELEDGFELVATHPGVASASTPLPGMGVEFATEISNGHMIAESAPDFLRSLAAAEARFAARGASLPSDDEGNEPDDFDPALPAIFSGMTTDADSNIDLLSGVFGGVESGGFDHAAFEAFIGGLNLRYFSASEFLFLGNSNNSGGCKGKNSLPPQSLWPRLTNTALMIDEIRHRLGASVTISSAFRAKPYNSCIGGATKSQHMNFNALDWRCSSGTPSDWFKVVTDLRDENPSKFNGFIQQYNTFVHIDTRHV
ncbi:N-acetylmuramoyl-L-alanine amidase [Ruegeria sp. Ofav3-42]|uniref:N-acetylmuramoyl-L-alanine amidase n=1 Tax=Ruegeria sp. Ofav3-42 TaxID=2917759 RepID=UPI001EF6BC92|nr:N-acetylmuramoyl-L-alanine amidase [Ruegeria sp. Ofav3-42]MCG7522772.1 N-acetylmuramoyl-L-alanine amidase [Ruegeria sp. Ofav3-42]